MLIKPTASPPAPQRPILGWRSFERVAAPPLPAFDELPHLAVSSGRAALYQALLLLKVGAGEAVLVPSYHCPTMVAAVLKTGAMPRFFPVGVDGLPALAGMPESVAGEVVRAIIVPHYFGRTQSLAAVRAWCDQRGVALIEDCAHSYFGMAGERAVGAWGDYAAA
ncbi:MAG TPA: DegT/DnrJ/EryC1/StrS family aminotransferase, partial [Burkholderiaceae bacterium]